MNNLSDDDPQLTNFLRQHRAIAPTNPEITSIELEDRMMSRIESVSIRKKQRATILLWRQVLSIVGLATTGLIGATIHYLMNPPEASVTELHQLDRYLIAHSRSFAVEPVSIENSDDLDAFILQDDDTENI